MSYLLIIDDDADFAGAVRTVCESAGYEVAVIHTLTEAVGKIEERRPDGILLDVMFPEDPSGGFDLARQIRHQFGLLPILMITAVNQQFPLGFGKKDIDPDWLPVTEFVEKPVEFPILLDRVKMLLAGDPEGQSVQ